MEDDTRARVEALLGRSVAAVERVSEDDRRNYVARVRFEDGGTAFVKRRKSDEGGWAFFNDWAGPEFLTPIEARPPHSPRYLGGDREAGMIVLEDVPHEGSMVEPLTGDDPAAAEAALVELAERLGRLHGDTAGRVEEYARLRGALEPGADGLSWATREARGSAFDEVRGHLERLELPLDDALLGELRDVVSFVGEPGPFAAYIHGDPCPDNVLRTPEGLRLIDFEIGGIGLALLDGVYGEMAFPTCWCANRVPDEIVRRMEVVYRRELARGCAAAADDRLFGRAYAAACATWLLGYLRGAPEEEDRRWGIATVRQRVVYRAERVARVCEERGQFPALGRAATLIGARLRERWPELEPLPLYPAFRRA